MVVPLRQDVLSLICRMLCIPFVQMLGLMRFRTLTSADLRVNEALCRAYVEDMGRLGRKVVETHGEPSGGSTDMGNVSHYVPSFHGMFSVTKEPDVVIHNPGFTACAATDEAHAEATRCAKGMAMLAIRVLVDDVLADKAREDFKRCDE